MKSTLEFNARKAAQKMRHEVEIFGVSGLGWCIFCARVVVMQETRPELPFIYGSALVTTCEGRG